MDVLGKFVKSARKLDKRITNENKKQFINEFNKYAKGYGFKRVSKDASVSDLNKIKSKYVERLGYDILTTAIDEGNTTIAEVYSKDYKKAKDKDVRKLSQYASKLAEVKNQNDKKLTPSEKAFLEKGNQNIVGYGSENVVSEFEKAKNKTQINKLIETLDKQDPKKEFYEKHIETLLRVFQKVGGVRENDLDKVIEKIKDSSFFEVYDKSNYLLQSLELYGSDQIITGAGGDDETELANARLDDMMIQLGLKNKGKKTVKNVLSKYKERTDKARKDTR